MILHSIVRRRPHRRNKVRFVRKRTKAVFQTFHNRLGILRLHSPDRHLLGNCTRTGIRHVKQIPQPDKIAAPVKYGDTGGAAVDPPPVFLFPFCDFQHRRCVRALAVYEQRIVKRTAVIAAGCP